MIKAGLKNWKTTLTGLVIAIVNAMIPVVQGGSPTGKQLFASVGIAIAGLLSSDAGLNSKA